MPTSTRRSCTYGRSRERALSCPGSCSPGQRPAFRARDPCSGWADPGLNIRDATKHKERIPLSIPGNTCMCHLFRLSKPCSFLTANQCRRVLPAWLQSYTSPRAAPVWVVVWPCQPGAAHKSLPPGGFKCYNLLFSKCITLIDF